MRKISTFIIAKNESNRITYSIKSALQVSDEVIVVDSGSTDDTVYIAKSLGARVFFKEWQGYVKQKAFAESLCKNDWILNIDADEELTGDLVDEILNIPDCDSSDASIAYTINIVVMHRNDTDIRKYAPSNRVIRLYNRKYASFANADQFTTHDSVTFNDDIKKSDQVIIDLKSPARHRSVTSIEQLVNKMNFYTTEQAKDLFISNRRPNVVRILFEMPIQFVKMFFLRRYFIFGFNGFIDAVIISFVKFMRLAKARELFIHCNK